MIAPDGGSYRGTQPLEQEQGEEGAKEAKGLGPMHVTKALQRWHASKRRTRKLQSSGLTSQFQIKISPKR